LTNEEKLYLEIGNQCIGAIYSQMFGKPCFKINGKAFLCFFKNEMVFKLSSPDHGEALQLLGAQLFDPSGKGRAMKEWVQLPSAHSAKWEKFAQAAMAYVSSKP
jgi:hypothetical protein